MSWLIGLMVVIVFLVCLVKFPRATLGTSALIIAGAGLFVYLVFIAPERERDKLEQQVTVQVTYDTQACSTDYPLLIIVGNTSHKTVTRVHWRIDMYRPGYSSNLAGHRNDYETDKIIGPKKRWRACYRLPQALDQKARDVSTLEYRVSGKYSSFAD
jgi:hypothetical protein